MVSIHAPARGATRERRAHARRRHGFNPRAREGRDLDFALPADMIGIVSIHAPARGATRFEGELCNEFSVSIHAPARGATAVAAKYAATLGSFNPRAREGRDTHISPACLSRDVVSIHAPARGATPTLTL